MISPLNPHFIRVLRMTAAGKIKWKPWNGSPYQGPNYLCNTQKYAFTITRHPKAAGESVHFYSFTVHNMNSTEIMSTVGDEGASLTESNIPNTSLALLYLYAERSAKNAFDELANAGNELEKCEKETKEGSQR